MNGLERKDARWSPHLFKIARELGTTVAYLAGETDDPDADALPSPPEPQHQVITLSVLLPSEAALTRMYEGQLAAFARLEGAELARALAKRLPGALARFQGVALYQGPAEPLPKLEDAPLPAIDHPAPRRARRT